MNCFKIIRLFLIAAAFSFFAGCDNTIFPLKQSTPLVSDQEEFTRQIEIPPNTKILEFHHRGGNITIIGWDKPYILVEGVTRASAETVQMARSIIELVNIIAYERPINRLVLDYEGPAGFARGKIPEEGLDYTANVPRNMLIDLKSETGTISISNIDSDVYVEHQGGDARVESIAGSLTMEITGVKKEGNRIQVKSIQRHFVLNSQYEDVEISDVKGDVDIDHKEGILRVSDVGGKLTLDGVKTPVELSRIKGFLQLKNEGGDLVCNGFYDGVNAEVDDGTLRLEPGVPVTRAYDCSVNRGNLILRIPENSSLSLEVSAINGSIHSEYPLQVSAENKYSFARGAIGKGFPMVRLNVERGSVTILREIPAPSSETSQTEFNEPEISTEGAIPVSTLQATPISR